VKELKIHKINKSTHEAKHAHNRWSSVGLLFNGQETQITQDPIKRMPPGGCTLLEGSHHEIKEQNR
jgi:hypothetical protein